MVLKDRQGGSAVTVPTAASVLSPGCGSGAGCANEAAASPCFYGDSTCPHPIGHPVCNSMELVSGGRAGGGKEGIFPRRSLGNRYWCVVVSACQGMDRGDPCGARSREMLRYSTLSPSCTPCISQKAWQRQSGDGLVLSGVLVTKCFSAQHIYPGVILLWAKQSSFVE